MKLFFAFVTSLFFALPAFSSSNEVMLEMIDFITERTSYKYQGEPLPFIELRSTEELCRAVYSPETLKLIDECSVAGYYDFSLRTVFIATESGPYMVDEYFFETVLVHELVHYLQYLNDAHLTAKCRNALEADAYRIQKEYVVYMGYPEEQKPDPLFAMFISSCGDYIWFSE
jgi:AraC-like DNA-binding protein